MNKLFSKSEPESTLHGFFEKQVRLTPKAIAVCDNEQALTYAQLNEKANQGAQLLLDSGVGLEDAVGLCADQSVNLVVMLLAILKSGAAYLPLDPTLPKSRRDYICKDAEVKMVFSTRKIGIESDDRFEVVFMESAASISKANPSPNSRQPEDDLACILYTSGSTGVPKGVEICHKGMVNVIQYRINEILKKKERMVVPLTASLDFDASAAQIFTPLCCGGKLVVVENIFMLSRSPYFDEITCVGSTPSVVKEFLESYTFPSSLRVLFLGGENVGEDLCRTIWNKTKVNRLINLYGPTEATVHVTYSVLFDRKRSSKFEESIRLPITIGKPINNCNIHILDGNLKSCDVGDPGEIYITGIGLARSYRNDKILTGQQFIDIEINDNRIRAYKTGDLGLSLPNGEIQFLGRKDRQVKVFGYRIELDEIEAKLTSHVVVKQCAVEAYDESSTKCIVAFVVPIKVGVLSADELVKKLRKDLLDQLPISMQPRVFKVLEKLPLTDRGKIDRTNLSFV